MDNTKKELIKAELKSIEEKLKKNAGEKDQLLVVKNYWHGELGLPVVDIKTSSNVNPQPQSSIPEPTVFEKGDFFGLSQAHAAHEVLTRSGGALTTDQILKIFQDSGYDVGGANPKRTLYVSLSKSRKMVLVAKNTFDLAERRPSVKKPKNKGVKKKTKTKATK